jgi:hypothetical protein
MKLKKNFSTVLLIVVIISVSIILGGNLVKSNITTTNLSAENPLDVVNSSQKQRSEEIILKIDIFGYRVCPTDENPIERDELGILNIAQKEKLTNVEIEIVLKFGEFNFLSIPVEKELILDLNGDFIIRYEIEDPLQGFFMEVNSLFDVTMFNLAFNNGIFQFNYDGILDKGNNDFQLDSASDLLIFNENSEFPQVNKLSIDELKQEISSYQKNSLKIDNKRYLESIKSKSILSPITFINYGLVHENWIKYDSWIGMMLLPADLPDYWESNTNIDIGVRRDHGSESQVKSDIQLYSTDLFEGGHGYVHDILAYEMVTHGGDSWYLYQHVRHQFLWWIWWTWEHTSTIVPSEIRNLWYHSYDPLYDIEIDVYPTNTIVFADVCHGYSDSSSGMAHAWYDYGATAFVGATIDVPIYEDGTRVNDQFVGAFWEELCENGGTIHSATIALCNNYGHGWNLNDEWKIMGSQYATLP